MLVYDSNPFTKETLVLRRDLGMQIFYDHCLSFSKDFSKILKLTNNFVATITERTFENY